MATWRRHLKPARDGIGVQVAWARGAHGTGVQFIDGEQGWLLNHEDLLAGIRLIHGQNRQRSFGHGAAVLGVVAATDTPSAYAASRR